MKPSKLVTLLLAAATAAALGSAGSAAPVKTRTLATGGPVVALSADGSRIAVATAGLRAACDRIVLWNAPARTTTRWSAHTNCPGGATSGGQHLTEVALAGTRVLWVESASGNDQDLSLWSAAPGHKATMLAFASNGNGAGGDPAGDYLGRVHADGTLAAFNTWTICERIHRAAIPPPLCPPGATAHQTLWRVTAGGKQALRRNADTTYVAAVDAGRIAVQHANGSVTLFSASGAPLAQIGIPGGRFAGLALSGKQLAVIRNGSLEVYSTATGALTKRIALLSTPAPTLRDLDAGLAVYTAGRTVHVVKVATGRNRAWATPTTAVGAQLETTGLWYAYNLATGSARGRVPFVPRAQVAARLR